MEAPATLEAYRDGFPSTGSLEAQIKYLLTSAMRAPSTHNSQPWKFAFTDSGIKIYRDESIKLPYSDPKGRYTYVSIGFLLHHIAVLAAYSGMQCTCSAKMNDDEIAELTFTTSTGFNPQHELLARAVFTRRNRRGAFLPDAVPENVLAAAKSPSIFAFTDFPVATVSIATSQEDRTALAGLTAQNMKRVYAMPAFRREMSRWITPTGSPRRTGLPGYTLNQPVVMSWILPTMIRTFNMGPVLAKLNFGALATSNAIFGFSNDESPTGWIGTGFQASHAALTLIGNGIDYSVFVASIEYDDTRAQAGEIFKLQKPLQFLFAAGKLPGTVDWRTPRIPIEKKLYVQK